MRSIAYDRPERRHAIEYDKDKVDEMTLALLYLVMHGNKDEERVWKGFEDAARLSEKLFQKHFGKK